MKQFHRPYRLLTGLSSPDRFNRLRRSRQRSPLLLFLILLALIATGPILAQELTTPAEPPVAATGLPIHAERCATCHGVRGLGDGELASGLPNPPAAHASLEYLRAAVPANMFEVVSNGRVSRGMPPFGPASSNPLSEAERWDVIAAVYSLGTPPDSVEEGRELYQENCLQCHGESGAGEGALAIEEDIDPGDLSDLGYWSTVSNQTVFDRLSAGDIEGHDFEFDGDQLWPLVDYIRTFSYEYADVLAGFRPLEAASIGGTVANATTGEILDDEAEVVLRGFDSELQISIVVTDTLDENGQYRFELTDVPQENFYRASVRYDGIEFGSEFAQLSAGSPELDLPITVYDKTSDPSGLAIQQLHLVLLFDQNNVNVSELYVVGNSEPTVYAGASGDPSQGTFEFSLPSDAENISFQRGFGSVDSFIPANEVIASGDGWADTLPLRPGGSSLTMLVQYTLPYEDGATIAHPVNYDTFGVNLVLPDAGVTLDEGDDWVNNGSQVMGNSSVTTYGQSDLPAGSLLSIDLDGRPSRTSAPSGSLIRDNSTELIAGVIAAGLVVAVAVVAVRRWRVESVEEMDRDELLEAIAALDDAYESGKLGEREYQREREALMAELTAVWEHEE